MVNIDEIRDITIDIVENSKGYISDDKIVRFKSFIDEKLDNFKPSLMVYGTYNSGKSTLLNALFGKDEMAKTGDAPETFEVTEYNYKGYTLYDTPGINAPVEHELITEEHLRKSELILFVLSNDGSFEERFIYDRVANVIILNKPILIVVNNKSGVQTNSEEEMELLQKINENLKKIGDEVGIDSIEKRVDIIIVNAKSALNGKINGKKVLLKRSNILQLEQKIGELISKSNSDDVINTLTHYINSFIDSVIDEINSKIENENLKRVEELKADIRKLKKATANKLYEVVERDANLSIEILSDLLLEQDRGAIDNYIAELLSDEQSYIEREIKNAQEELKVRVLDFNSSADELKIEKDRLKIDNIDITPNSEGQRESSSSKDVGNLIEQSLPSLIATLPLKIPMAIINIATNIISAFIGSSKEKMLAKARAEAKRERYMIAKNKASKFAFEFEKSFKQAVDESLNTLFNNTIKDLNSLSLKLDRKNSKIRIIKDKLDSLRVG